jgi:hypothetical protein
MTKVVVVVPSPLAGKDGCEANTVRGRRFWICIFVLFHFVVAVCRGSAVIANGALSPVANPEADIAFVVVVAVLKRSI